MPRSRKAPARFRLTDRGEDTIDYRTGHATKAETDILHIISTYGPMTKQEARESLGNPEGFDKNFNKLLKFFYIASDRRHRIKQLLIPTREVVTPNAPPWRKISTFR